MKKRKKTQRSGERRWPPSRCPLAAPMSRPFCWTGTSLLDWNKADAECLQVRIYEKQHGIHAALDYIKEYREIQQVQHVDGSGQAIELLNSPVARVWWDRESEKWRCAVRQCRGWSRNKKQMEVHIGDHDDDEEFQFHYLSQEKEVEHIIDKGNGELKHVNLDGDPIDVPHVLDDVTHQVVEQIEGAKKTVPIRLYHWYREMDRQRQAADFKASKLPHEYYMYFQSRVEQAKIVREYELDQALGHPTGDVTEIKNALKEGKVVLSGRRGLTEQKDKPLSGPERPTRDRGSQVAKSVKTGHS